MKRSAIRSDRLFDFVCLVLAVLLLVAASVQLSRAAEEVRAEKIVVIGGSVAEIVYRLGEEDRLIARDRTSSYPEAVTGLPDIGYMRALSPEGVLSVGPDMILSLEGAGPPDAVEALKQAGIRFVEVPEGYDADAVLRKIEATADALGVPEKGARLKAEIAEDFAALGTVDGAAEKPSVMFILSMAGGRVMAAGSGNHADGMIGMAGGENVFAGMEGYKPVTEEAIVAAAPDLIVMMDRGGDHGADNAAIAAHPALGVSPAGRNGAVIRMDGLRLLGFGPRTPQAIADLRRAFETADNRTGDASQ